MMAERMNKRVSGKVMAEYQEISLGDSERNRGRWFVGAIAVHDNSYDGHALTAALDQVERISGNPEHAFVDMSCRGHGYSGAVKAHVDKRRRRRTAKSVWRWMKRRAAIAPGIGHLKREHRLDRNRLKGV